MRKYICITYHMAKLDGETAETCIDLPDGRENRRRHSAGPAGQPVRQGCSVADCQHPAKPREVAGVRQQRVLHGREKQPLERGVLKDEGRRDDDLGVDED